MWTAEGSLIHEVHRIRARGNVVVGEDRAAAEFEVWRNAAMALEVPLEAERIESHAIRGVRGLKDQEDRDGVYGIFEASAKKARKMRAGEDPSIAQSGVEGAGILCAARD